MDTITQNNALMMTALNFYVVFFKLKIIWVYRFTFKHTFMLGRTNSLVLFFFCNISRFPLCVNMFKFNKVSDT